MSGGDLVRATGLTPITLPPPPGCDWWRWPPPATSRRYVRLMKDPTSGEIYWQATDNMKTWERVTAQRAFPWMHRLDWIFGT